MEKREEGVCFGCYTRASCQGIQSDSFTKENLPNGTSDGGAVFNGFKDLSLPNVPFDSDSFPIT